MSMRPIAEGERFRSHKPPAWADSSWQLVLSSLRLAECRTARAVLGSSARKSRADRHTPGPAATAWAMSASAPIANAGRLVISG